MSSKTGLLWRIGPSAIALASLIACCPGLRASGPWVPFVAQRVSKTYQLGGKGKKLISEESQVYLRNSQGSIYLRSTPVIGTNRSGAPETATLEDATTGTTYLIDYSGKRVLVQRKGKPLSPPTSSSFHRQMPQDRFIGRRTIAGIQCEGYRLLWSPGAPKPNFGRPAGEVWVAPSLNFAQIDGIIEDYMMKREIEVTVVSITPGQEPDPELFRIPRGFSMQ